LLIRQLKYSAILSKIHDCFFGDFAHWEINSYDIMTLADFT